MNRTSQRTSPCLDPLESPPLADRILVVRLGALGDVVRTIPAALRIRGAYPGAHLAWLVEPPAASLLQTQPWIDEVIVFPRNSLVTHLRSGSAVALSRESFRFLSALRRPRFDLVVDFHSILRSGLLSWCSAARTRVAYSPPVAREFAHWFASHRARLRVGKLSRWERNRALVDFLGIAPATELAGAARFELDRMARRRIDVELGARPAVVAIHPGTSEGTPYKRYSAEGFAQIARGLAAATGAPALVISGPARGEQDLASEIVRGAGGAARPAPATPTVADLAALLARCRLVVGADSGPLQLAALLGTPVVQLLGPSDPVENAPSPEAPSRTLRVGLDCSPCRRGCAAAPCMKRISPASAISAALELLDRDSAAISTASVSR